MIYLDYAASSPPFSDCAVLISELMCSTYGNPAALHGAGTEARKILQDSRRRMARLLGVRDREVFFTSGGTEANNWAVKLGCQHRPGGTLLVGAAEHSSVLESARSMESHGFRVRLLPPDSGGHIRPEDVLRFIGPDTALLCVQAVNNETGAVQDVEAISAIAKKHRVPFLCDAVQSFGHLAQPLHSADLITLSAHKFGGPRGVGCLIARYPHTPKPFLHGGGQELGLRSGTENIPGIAAMVLAAERSAQLLSQEQERLGQLSGLLWEGLRQIDPRLERNGSAPLHPGILNCRFPDISGEALTLALARKGICVSPGAACAARDPSPSHVLLAMGCSADEARNSLRFSLGCTTTQQDIMDTIHAVEEILTRSGKGESTGGKRSTTPGAV